MHLKGGRAFAGTEDLGSEAMMKGTDKDDVCSCYTRGKIEILSKGLNLP